MDKHSNRIPLHQNSENIHTEGFEYPIKIKRGRYTPDKSEYSEAKIVEVSDSLLSKQFIIQNINCQIVPCVIWAILAGLACIFVFTAWIRNDFSSPVICAYIVFIPLLIMPVSIIDRGITIKKMVEANNFLLVKAQITYIHEDMCPDSESGKSDCYLSIRYVIDNLQKTVVIKAYGRTAEEITKIPTAYLFIPVQNGVMEETPKVIFLGCNYIIDDEIPLKSQISSL